MGRRLLVLGWHNVDPTPFFPAPSEVGRCGFERQLAVIDKLASVVPLSEATSTLAAGGTLPPRAVALTFDDGYADSLTAVVPALDRRGMHGTFFLVSDILSGRVGAWWEDLADVFARGTAARVRYDGEVHDVSTPEARRQVQATLVEELKRIDRATRVEAVADLAAQMRVPVEDQPPPWFLDWDGARALAATGHDIGSHTVTHPILSRETPDAQTAELVESRRALQDGLGHRVDLLAYPNGNEGDYDRDTMDRARDAGYRAAVTTRPGFVAREASPYAMRRVVLTPLTDVRALLGKVVRKGLVVLRP